MVGLIRAGAELLSVPCSMGARVLRLSLPVSLIPPLATRGSDLLWESQCPRLENGHGIPFTAEITFCRL